MCAQHKHDIDGLCDLMIKCCITARLESIPARKSRSRVREVPGWSEQVKPDTGINIAYNICSFK